MVRCDCCGKDIPERDFSRGAVRAIHDQIETDSLCINCNKETENVGEEIHGTEFAYG